MNKGSLSPLAQKMGLLSVSMEEKDGLWRVLESMSWKGNCHYLGLLMMYSIRLTSEFLR